MATAIDRRQVERWLREGVSLHAIARRLAIPWTTFWRQWQRLQLETATPVHADITEMPPRSGPPAVDTSLPAPTPSGPPDVHPGIPAELQAIQQDLLEVVEWWRERKLRRVHPGPPRDTERWTVHVDTRWIEAVKQEAAAEGVPIMTIVDRAFRQYFEGR
jgi:predicted DNA binding CopG/RHH family protein